MSDDVMQFQMYGIKELPNHVRKTFNLPSNPYEEGREEALEYLRELGIVFFRDNYHTSGVIIDQEEQGSTLKIAGVKGFKFSAICDDDDTFTPQMWNSEDHSDAGLTYEQYVEKYGDDRSWMLWNVPCFITKVTRNSVTSG